MVAFCGAVFLSLTLFGSCVSANDVSRPNIVIVMADDMGFDDVSFRGSNGFLTPNIDALAYSGIILNDLYTPAMCTPSRAALLTGKYPINTGMQHYVIPNDQPWGLPLNETTMPQVFQANGYDTTLIGKWHLGMSQKAYTPTMRGFDRHFGYLGAYIDYYDQTLLMGDRNYSRGHDFRDGQKITYDHVGTYVTDLLTQKAIEIIQNHDVAKKPLFMLLSHLAPHSGNDDDPLQAPKEELEKFSYITNTTKKTYAAMMSVLDRNVGHLVHALAKKNILNNTIILFLSDNGGPTMGQHATTASNYPLRGQKDSPWEGAIRSSAAIWSTAFEKLGTVWKQRIYSADLLPTLAAAAGIDLSSNNNKLDGLNLWSALKYGYESVEREIVHNIDEIYHYVSYMKGKWKFINGTTLKGQYDGWLGTRTVDASEWDTRVQDYEQLVRNTSVWQDLSPYNVDSHTINITELRAKSQISCRYQNASEDVACNPLLAPCLFDLDVDPCEQHNLYNDMINSTMLLEMLKRIEAFRAHAHPPNNKPADPQCDPRYYHNEWTWWEDEQKNNVASGLSKQYFLFSILGSTVVSLTMAFCKFRSL